MKYEKASYRFSKRLIRRVWFIYCIAPDKALTLLVGLVNFIGIKP
jgi:hypothetical protein